jgi:hypothetical protein
MKKSVSAAEKNSCYPNIEELFCCLFLFPSKQFFSIFIPAIAPAEQRHTCLVAETKRIDILQRIFFTTKNFSSMKKTIYVPDTRSNRRMAARSLKSKQAQRTNIILLPAVVVFRTVIAVLDMPTGNLERGARAKEIADACAASIYVSVDPVIITAILDGISAYNGASTATRQSLWREVHNGVKALMHMFQEAADRDPFNAVAIIESGKFKVKQMPSQQKHKFEARNNLVSGTVDLIAPGGPQHSCHDWRYSTDGITFERLHPTIDAHAQVHGLTPLTYAYFTHEIITKDGPQGISQVIKMELSGQNSNLSGQKK